MTKLAAIGAAAFCGFAGVYLLSVQAAAPDSILETIAHGLGIYMIGKGIFVGALLWKQDSLERTTRQLGRDD